MGLATIDPHSQKEHTEIHKIPKFAVYQASQKIYKENLQRPDGHTFLCKLTFSNGCIFLTIGSIYTKLGDFVKLNQTTL